MTLTKRIAVGLTALVALSATACTSTFKAKAVDPSTGYFATKTVVPDDEVKTNEPMDVDAHKQVLFVRSNLDAVESYDGYFEEALGNIGFFDQVVRKDAFERYLVQQGLAAKVGSVDGYTGLSNAAAEIGDFMVVEFDVEAKAGYQVIGNMKVLDPKDATVKLEVNRQITNWAGLDGVLFEPLFNRLIKFLDENSATFNPGTGSAAAGASQ